MKKKASAKKRSKQFVLITGLSGSGKGSVLKTFEDLGYQCVDNLPIDLIPKFAEMCQQPGSRLDRAAAVVDIRGGEALSQLPTVYRDLTRNDLKPSMVFLEASDKALMRRFEETRRPHPLGRDLPVREGIRLERMLLKPMRQLASVVIDTTRLNVHELRDLIQTRFGGIAARRSMLISAVSFGYRFGVPPDADLVFDVRFLPNPNFVPRLKNKTGRDVGVRRFMNSHPQTHEFTSRLMNLLLYLLPQYVREGKSYLTIAIGCTGGRHRSVFLTEEVANALVHEGYKTKVAHRDIGR
ncbi:MAG TPA: RNase adapter RapZ [Terriglobia bacterium]|nr:RNase adapter RapZ [Terriglobia bacterium]